MTMREARIILPIPGGPASEAVHQSLVDGLVATFGGVTITEGRGAWKHPNGTVIAEPVRVYDVAVETNKPGLPQPITQLRSMAVLAGRMLGQHSVYVRDTSNTVAIIELPAGAWDRLAPGEGAPAESEIELAHPVTMTSEQLAEREPQVGEVWKRRDGAEVLIERIVASSSCPVYGRKVNKPEGTGRAWLRDGRYIGPSVDDHRDLVEFVRKA